MASTDDTFMVTHAELGFALATRGSIVVASVGQAFTIPRLRTLRRARERANPKARSTAPLAFGDFDLSQYDVRNLGGSGVRSEIRSLFGEGGPKIQAIATVLEGGGLVAVTIRSTITALVMVTRPACVRCGCLHSAGTEPNGC